jgi:hypothetical protein
VSGTERDLLGRALRSKVNSVTVEEDEEEDDEDKDNEEEEEEEPRV